MRRAPNAIRRNAPRLASFVGALPVHSARDCLSSVAADAINIAANVGQLTSVS